MNNKVLLDRISAYMTRGTYQYSAGAYSYECRTSFFSPVFLLDVNVSPRSGISEIRDLFCGPIWMRLENICSFCVGQVPGTSHVATRPKTIVSDASVPRCRGLLQPAPPPVCSSLSCLLDVIRIPGTTVLTVASPLISPPVFCRLVL